MRIAIIGGGAAGFFAAIAIKEQCPNHSVAIYERAGRCLAKVEVSGGGRCNCTNSFEEVRDLKSVYPRGHQLMKRLFKVFDHEDAYQWFEDHGVALTTQEDQCVFPVSQDSHSITLCLQNEARRLGVKVCTHHKLVALRTCPDSTFELDFENQPTCLADMVLITAGGQPKPQGLLHMLQQLGQPIVPPVPSLFTLTIPHAELTALMGVVVEQAILSIPRTNFKVQAPLLITHWGMSGPAALKLSSHAARMLAEQNYEAEVMVNWVGETNVEIVTHELQALAGSYAQRQLSSVRPFNLQSRLWHYLLQRSGLPLEKPWAELGKKGLNKLVNTLTADVYRVSGRYPHREEFVTCGGVALSEVLANTLESKVIPNLYFAGEVLDIDAVTGGFNLQAAWTTGYVAALGMAKAAL
jgi:predicted Rossmann fold flavoprotein